MAQETAIPKRNEFPSEKIVRSMCSQCWNGCGIQIHLQDEIITKVDGDPENPQNLGVICAKGQVGPQGVYSPYRIKKPMKRTNPEKGLEIDPKWKEISWEEALSTISEHLKILRNDNPKKLMYCAFDVAGGNQAEYRAWTTSFGSPNYTPGSADFFCGNSVHTMHYLNQASFHGGVDFKFCKYLLQLGTQWGSVVNTNILAATHELADARASGRMKVVVVDPWCSFAGSKADEWIPIRPGTDAAFVLSLVNVMINELGKYDEQFLKKRTNAPYLVGQDKLYLRDAGTGKPLIWDPVDDLAKDFDDPSIKDYCLLGEFDVAGKKCKPGFQLIKDHVKKYTPEWVSEVTTVPASTIRKTAKEWVEQARIGETVEIEGERIPLRPVAVNWYRGTSAHKHSTAIGYAIMMLPTLVGAIDVPGGAMGEGRMRNESTTSDGLLATENKISVVQPPYPPRTVSFPPDSSFYFELFPIAPYSPVMVPLTQLNPEKYKLPYRTEMVIQVRNNFVKSSGPTDIMEKWIKTVPFVVSFSIVMDETATMSDIVLPDIYYLEREGLPPPQTHPGIEGTVFQYMQHQAAPPPFDPPYNKITSVVDILLELAKRAGFLDDFYNEMNLTYGLKGEYILKNKNYSWNDILDLRLKNSYGSDRGLDWFKKNQVLTWPKNVRVAYPGAFRKARIHLYYEFIEKAGEDVARVTKDNGIPWEVSDYEALPEWKPCPSFNPRSKDYDLWIISSKIPTHTLSGSIYYPALISVTGSHMFDKGVMMNADTASKKGIKFGDWIVIETETGKKARAMALASEVCHPEVVVCFGNHGRRVSGIPNAKGIGVDFNGLLELDEEHIDFVDGALDSCIRVKVYKENSTRE
ncbi:MAG: molybdopterin-dependent oxidoreductase [Nitrososphaerales archaeon]